MVPWNMVYEMWLKMRLDSFKDVIALLIVGYIQMINMTTRAITYVANASSSIQVS